jgi:hypothetical protein
MAIAHSLLGLIYVALTTRQPYREVGASNSTKRSGSASFDTTSGGWANSASASRHEFRTMSLSILDMDHGSPVTQPPAVREGYFRKNRKPV